LKLKTEGKKKKKKKKKETERNKKPKETKNRKKQKTERNKKPKETKKPQKSLTLISRQADCDNPSESGVFLNFLIAYSLVSSLFEHRSHFQKKKKKFNSI
jgi:hypothetical protein